jgi:hypothetical protein
MVVASLEVVMRTVAACVVVAWMVAGCGVTSDHPLSDASDSIVDEQAIGWWEVEPKEDEADKPRERLVIGRVADKPRTMEVVWTALDKQGHVVVQRLPLYATEIQGKRYVSVAISALKPQEDAGNKGWVLYRYLVEGDFLTLESLSPAAVAGAIRAGKIAGNADDKAGPDPQAHLTATKAALRAWVTNASWVNESGERLRRVPLDRTD